MKLVVKRIPSRSRLLRNNSSDSTDSCFNVYRGKEPSLGSPFRKGRRPARSVSFNDSETEVYSNPNDLTPEEIEATWYSNDDMECFHRETSELASQLIHSRRCRPFQRAYLAFNSATSIKAVQFIMKHSKLPVTDKTRGMETYMLRPQEKQAQTIRLMQQVQYWNATTECEEEERAEKICRASSFLSRSDRLFACHVAMVAAQSTDVE
eukprot:scaffold4232_cov215-Amphora_coffeaeformis.AAC.7